MSLLWKDAEVGQGGAWPLGAGPQSSYPGFNRACVFRAERVPLCAGPSGWMNEPLL